MIHFFDPSLTTDERGESVPYKPERYKIIVKEQLYISKNSAASYSDTENMTPFEREIWVRSISKQNQEFNDQINNQKK